jgi:CheY-like chemotaxis protein
VLIVDDNATQRQVLASRLERQRSEVQLAVGGSTALELLQHAAESGHPYDIAIIDRQMPSMDGEQLARTIRSRTMLAGTRLVLLTSCTATAIGNSSI